MKCPSYRTSITQDTNNKGCQQYSTPITGDISHTRHQSYRMTILQDAHHTWYQSYRTPIIQDTNHTGYPHTGCQSYSISRCQNIITIITSTTHSQIRCRHHPPSTHHQCPPNECCAYNTHTTDTSHQTNEGDHHTIPLQSGSHPFTALNAFNNESQIRNKNKTWNVLDLTRNTNIEMLYTRYET